ncbi:sugar ABC transporter permease [Streptomyces abyssalis]|uniref:Sugar ABC transporter permease n=1 Tax=Streptomyces abyssalis TaxID=933944 RepID=A0A1E7JP88_9ACTN|nr:sugar ABC transporter permease [Streptomyces abyssalis]OEU86547.1 sugar ABC transporter permease [Streptomyces abyssalis]OEU90064.1 sugar ABC transporter permease [Streptomyces abyssalis]
MSTSTSVHLGAGTGAPATGKPGGGPGSGTARWTASGMLLPFGFFYVLFLLGPLVYTAVAGFFNDSLVKDGTGEWVGTANYAEALASPEFWSSLGHTLWFTVLTTVPLILLALTLALMTDRFSRGKWFFRLAFFAPFMLPSSVISLLFMWIYADQIGLAQGVVKWFGVNAAPSWLGDPDWAMISIAAATVWWTVGFNFVIYLAALQEIPRDVYEAAAIDGAGPWQRLRLVVIPMLGRATTLVAVLQLVASLKVFDQIYMMTNGGPDDATRPSLLYIFQTGFTDGRAGYASTVALLLFVIILLISLVWFALIRRTEKEG